VLRLDGPRAIPHTLIADDDTSIVEVLEAILADARCAAIPRMRGAQAVAAARTECPDLVLADLMTPEMNGIAVIEQLRDDHGHDFPVTLMSSDRNVAELAKNVHLADWIRKPFWGGRSPQPDRAGINT
jgi:CheY-like chemotaxis protein